MIDAHADSIDYYGRNRAERARVKMQKRRLIREAQCALVRYLLEHGRGSVDNIRAELNWPDVISERALGAVTDGLCSAGVTKQVDYTTTRRANGTVGTVAVWELTSDEAGRNWLSKYSSLAAPGESPSHASQNGLTCPTGSIPSEYRTKPVSKCMAARCLGRPSGSSAVRWLNDCISKGVISCEPLTRQTNVFDLRQFPSDIHYKLRAQPR
jgi:hypothetical protein